MRNFIAKFYHTLTTPENWNPLSLLTVGIGFAFALSVLAGGAFDAQF